MNTLYLCEKPSQAKDIAAVLNITTRKDGYYENEQNKVTWCIGHLLEMANPDDYDPRYKKWSFESLPILPDTWKMNVTAKLSKQFNVIKRLLKQTQHVTISTDADREGETIAREILDLCHYQGSVNRLWLSALDAKSILKALDNILPDHQTRPLYYAGLGRGRADWLIGMNLTRAYTLLSKQAGGNQVVSVGRVQTPTLNLVVQRDLEIESFQSVPFYDLVIDCDAANTLFKAKWVAEQSGIPVDSEGRCLDQSLAETVAQQVDQQAGFITRFEKSIKEESPPLPFDLSSLQIEASKQFGLDAYAVLKAAQRLYETHKATTYPRTDCRYLPISQFDEAKSILIALQQSDPDWTNHSAIHQAAPTLQSRCWNDKKITAHHAIIPTEATVDIDQLSHDELKIYELIRQHFVMQFFPAHQYQAIVCETTVSGHVFTSRGRKDLIAGWRMMTGKNNKEHHEDQQDLTAHLEQGLSTRVVNTTCLRKETKPPARFTSGTLIAAMKNAGKSIDNPELRKVLKETSGIGTEATRASIIETLLDRTYLKKSGKYLISTDFARALISTVPEVLKDPGTTALWEQVLNDIANNQSTLESFMDKQKTFIIQMIEYLHQQQIEINYQRPEYPCPACGKPLRRITSQKPKKSVFWGCSDYPNCHQTLPDMKGKPGKKIDKKNASIKQLVVGQKCPQCSTGNLQLKTIQSGNNVGKTFIGCSNYPSCKAFSWSTDPT